MKETEPLLPFEEAYSSAVAIADSMWGGNMESPNGIDHFIADQWVSGKPLPRIFHDPLLQEIRNGDGVTPETMDAVTSFFQKQNPLDFPERAIELADAFDDTRRGVVTRTMKSVALMMSTALAFAEGSEPPPYEELYHSVIGEDPKLTNPAEERDRMKEALSQVGVSANGHAPLVEHLEKWRQQRLLASNLFKRNAEVILKKLIEKTRAKILSSVDFSSSQFGIHLEGISFEGLKMEVLEGVRFTGSLAYQGGEDSLGSPLLKALFEYNTDHQLTESELIHFLAHELFPGHYFNSAITDVLRREGNLGFETSVQTLCTSGTTFQEGWAQTGMHMLFGGTRESIIEALGPEFAVLLTRDELLDMARHDGPILFQVKHMDIASIQSLFRSQYAMTEEMVEKISGQWTTHPILGAMYSPSYLKGSHKLQNAMRRIGVPRVAEIGLHTEGFVDMQAFNEKVEQSENERIMDATVTR